MQAGRYTDQNRSIDSIFYIDKPSLERASEGHSVVNIVLNGGPWTIMEQNEAVKDSFPILAKTGTGRFADMISGALADSTWKQLPQQEQLERFMQLTETLPSEADRKAVRESLTKPFYRNEFMRFMNQMKTGVNQNVFAGDDNTFTEQLRGVLSSAR